MKQKRVITEGQLNRSRILNELLKSPLTFSKLKTKLKLSGKTLTNHLNDLKAENLVKREIQGKYIVYKIATPQTVLDLRKTFRKEFNHLLWVYLNCLDKDTKELLQKVDEALKNSINQPDWRAELKILEKTIPIPNGEKVTITQDLGDLYKKPKIEEIEKSKSKRKR